MAFVLVLRELWGRKLLLSLGVIIAAAAAILSVYHVNGTTLKSRALQYSAAQTVAFVDTVPSSLGNINEDLALTEARATLYANLMTSPQVLDLIGQIAGVPGDEIYAAGPVDQLQPRSVQEPTALKRNVELTGETLPYKLNFNNDPNLPNISIYAQAPTTAQAIALANASVTGLQEYIDQLEVQTHVRPNQQIQIRQLGQASGGVVNSGISKKLALMVFLGVFLLWCVLVLAGARVRDTWHASASVYSGRRGRRARPAVTPNGDAPAVHAVATNGDHATNGHHAVHNGHNGDRSKKKSRQREGDTPALTSFAESLAAHARSVQRTSEGGDGEEDSASSESAAVGS